MIQREVASIDEAEQQTGMAPFHRVRPRLPLNLPAADRLTEPRYQDLTEATVPVLTAPGARVRMFSGASHGVKSAIRINLYRTRLRLR